MFNTGGVQSKDQETVIQVHFWQQTWNKVSHIAGNVNQMSPGESVAILFGEVFNSVICHILTFFSGCCLTLFQKPCDSFIVGGETGVVAVGGKVTPDACSLQDFYEFTVIWLFFQTGGYGLSTERIVRSGMLFIPTSGKSKHG